MRSPSDPSTGGSAGQQSSAGANIRTCPSRRAGVAPATVSSDDSAGRQTRAIPMTLAMAASCRPRPARCRIGEDVALFDPAVVWQGTTTGNIGGGLVDHQRADSYPRGSRFDRHAPVQVRAAARRRAAHRRCRSRSGSARPCRLVPQAGFRRSLHCALKSFTESRLVTRLISRHLDNDNWSQRQRRTSSLAATLSMPAASGESTGVHLVGARFYAEIIRAKKMPDLRRPAAPDLAPRQSG